MDTFTAQLSQAEVGDAGALFRETFRAYTREAILSLVEEEVAALCGNKYDPSSESACDRAGSSPGTVYVNGAQERLKRPRVRELDEHGSAEVSLKTWQAAKDPEEWENAMMQAVLCGVSSRDMARLRTEELQGLSRSQVSRLWARKAAGMVEELNRRDLSTTKLAVLMLDGYVLSDDLHALIALGIDQDVYKQVLGFVIAGSENLEAGKALMKSMIDRGLSPVVARPLVVMDGSQGLLKAVLTHWPLAHIQRCLVHKERNLRGHLSKRHHGALAGYFKRLRKAEGAEAAHEIFDRLTEFLSNKNQAAQESLKEGVEDLLTVFRLAIPATLNATLLPTDEPQGAGR
jgi:putative transposase